MKDLLKLALVSAICMGSSAIVDAQTSTPLYDALAATEDTKLTDERVQQCLLAQRTIIRSIDLGLIDDDSNKAVRAISTAPKIEAALRERMQTEVRFDKVMGEVKAEYDVFKTADKKTQKNLYKIAKSQNKSCGRPYERMKLASLGRTSGVAKLMQPVTPETAKSCYAIATQNTGSFADMLDSLLQGVVWNRAYQMAKHRQGHPQTEKVEPLKRDEAQKSLKAMDKTRAMSLFKDCKQKYEEAAFEYKLNQPEEAPEFVSSVNWD